MGRDDSADALDLKRAVVTVDYERFYPAYCPSIEDVFPWMEPFVVAALDEEPALGGRLSREEPSGPWRDARGGQRLCPLRFIEPEHGEIELCPVGLLEGVAWRRVVLERDVVRRARSLRVSGNYGTLTVDRSTGFVLGYSPVGEVDADNGYGRVVRVDPETLDEIEGEAEVDILGIGYWYRAANGEGLIFEPAIRFDDVLESAPAIDDFTRA